MRCDEAEEFVSAVYDGETVPPQAAEHIAHCAACEELLKGYAEMGASLRAYGSLLLAEPVPGAHMAHNQAKHNCRGLPGLSGGRKVWE